MEIVLDISSDYGYVILVAAVTWVLLNWLGMNVMWAREMFSVPYPTMYSAHSDIFNCYQRAHQNTLEYYPFFLALLLLGGLQFPRLSAVSGLIWIAGRVAYAKGYYTGDPAKRVRGVWAYIGLVILLLNTIILAIRLLGYV